MKKIEKPGSVASYLEEALIEKAHHVQIIKKKQGHLNHYTKKVHQVYTKYLASSTSEICPKIGQYEI